MPISRFSTLIFDMDGTILNTLQDLYTATQNSLRFYNLPKTSHEETRRCVGNGARVLMERICEVRGCSDKVDALLAYFKKNYAEHHADTTCPYPHMLEVLQMLSSEGFKLAVLSNKPNSDVQALAELHFPHIFDIAEGALDTYPLKPAPDHNFAIMNALGSTARTTLYIGDSEVDVMCAQNTGCEHLVVSWGFRDVDTLIRAGATNIVHTTDELYRFIHEA